MENSITWIGDLGFKCINRNHEIILDVDKTSGSLDRGPTPKEALLDSAASCSAMDIIAILKKMRDLPTEFVVEIDKKINKNYPIYFTHIHFNYKLKGNTKPANVIKAVDSSLSKYCGVSYMISKVCEISYTIYINDEKVGEGFAKFIDPIG